MTETIEFLKLLIAAESLVIIATVLPLLAAGVLYAVFAMCREWEKEEKENLEFLKAPSVNPRSAIRESLCHTLPGRQEHQSDREANSGGGGK